MKTLGVFYESWCRSHLKWSDPFLFAVYGSRAVRKDSWNHRFGPYWKGSSSQNAVIWHDGKFM